MPRTMNTPQAQANAQAQATGRTAAQPAVPFAQASRRARQVALQFNVTPQVAPTILGPADLTPNGFLRAVELHVYTVTAGVLGPGVVAPGWPFSIFQNVQFIDTGGQKMDDLSGYQLFIDNYVSGRVARCDPRGFYDYSANPISPNFRLFVRREIFPDGRGSLPNLSGSQKYRMRLVIDAIAGLYSTAPTTAPTLGIDVIEHLWLLPAPADGGQRPQQRRPPLLGLAQYRTSIYPSVSLPNANVDEQIKTTGNLINYLAFWGRDNAGNPTDAVFPDPFTLRLDNAYPYDAVPLASIINEFESLIPGRVDRPPGLIILPFNYGWGNYAGFPEGVSSWLPTSTATWLELKGRQPVATPGQVDIVVCEISTAEIDVNERSALGSGTGTWHPAIPADVPAGV